NKDLRDCPTAYDCRERLPELSRWMREDILKEIPIYRGAWLKRGQLYIDLDNPARGAFVAHGDESPIVDHTYAARNEMSEEAWAERTTWCQPISRDQGEVIQANLRELGTGVERSAAGDARTLPRE